MIGMSKYLAAVLPFVGALLAYYILYFRKRQWMLDRQAFEAFLEKERRYKERAEPEQVDSYLDSFRNRRRRFVQVNMVVFSALGLVFFLVMVHLSAAKQAF